jgi:hypothetical protein
MIVYSRVVVDDDVAFRGRITKPLTDPMTKKHSRIARIDERIVRGSAYFCDGWGVVCG